MNKLTAKIENKKRIEQAVSRLFLAKQMIDKAKDAYREADELLEFLLNCETRIPQIVRSKGSIYEMKIEDLFQKKNTQWKAVAMRRFDVTFRKIK